MDAIKAILSRRSIRKYTDQQFLKKWGRALKAAISAPSLPTSNPGTNIIIDKLDILDKIPDFHPYADALFWRARNSGLRRFQFTIRILGPGLRSGK
jgi:nitroreductase